MYCTIINFGEALVIGWDEGLIALLGMHINDDLKFGVAYDIVMSEIKNNSLEFMLGYCFQVSYDRPVKSYKNPRFL